MKVSDQKDFASGLMYIVIGLGFAIVASGYDMGEASRMGPGYFPFGVGVLLAIVGTALLIRSYLSETAGRLPRLHIKSIAAILLSVAAFGALVSEMGIIVAVVALVAGSSLASRELSWPVVLLSAAFLVVISLLIFVYGLGLTFPVWPAFAR